MDLDGSLWPTPAPGIDLAAQLDKMVQSGVESLRVTFNWAAAQPYASYSQLQAARANPSAFTNVAGVPTDFAPLDNIVGLAAQRGLTILPEVLNAPGWDAVPARGLSVAVPAQVGPYANFAQALVQRYGPSGTFWSANPTIPKVPIRMWQIWNEPNTSTFWNVQPFAPTYVALLRAAHDAVKAADPGAQVVLAGLPNDSWDALDTIYAIPGASQLFDVVDLHPYTQAPSGVILILAKVRQTMAANGDAQKPMLAGEVSWPSALGQPSSNPFGYDFITTEAGQASNLAAVIPMLANDRGALGLLSFYYYNWASAEPRGGFAFDFSGLFRYASGTLVTKPAFNAFALAALAIEECSQKAAVATRCLKPAGEATPASPPAGSNSPKTVRKPVNTIKPRVRRSGKDLVCTRGTWANAPTRFSYRWLVGGKVKAGASRLTLAISHKLRGHKVQCGVTASTSAGTASALSAPFRVR